MLFNCKKTKIHKSTDCLNCEHFDKKLKKCLGIGKVCFEFDPITQTCIDPITKMTIKFNKGEK